MLPLNSVFFVSKITDCSTRISSDQLTHAMSWWQLLVNILDAYRDANIEILLCGLLYCCNFVTSKLFLLILYNMPSCCLLHFGFDDNAIIYGVIILLYYFFGCCQSYHTELWVFFSDHLMRATSWWQLTLNILGNNVSKWKI